MANENQNTGPSTNPQDLRKSLKELLDDQGDYNNLLKNAISDLKKMESAYGKIEARIASLNKDSINIKQVNQELLRLRQKEYLASKNLGDLEKEFSEESKKALSIARQKTEEVMEYARAYGEAVDFEETMLSYLKESGNIEATILYTAEKQLEIARQQTKEGEDALKNEKAISRQLGISGNLMKIFAEKIGVGEEAYAAMAFRARQVVDSQKDMGFFEKQFSKFSGAFKVLGSGVSSIGSSLLSNLADPVAMLGIGGALFKGLKAAFDYIVGIQDQTVKFARAMNLSTGEARKIKMEFASLSISSGDLFINSQKMVESQMELGDALGVTNRLTNEQLATNIKLRDIAGLDLETRKGILEASTLTGKSSEDITKSVLNQVVGLKQSTGIGLQYQKILKEASNLGGVLGLSFAKYPEKLTKSLVTVKSMGLELKQLDSIADSFLDFESSISKEFEAQLLTGKNINLAKAREAFLNNDLATAASEITKQVGSAADFLNMNRIQQESIASAMGMSRDQMADMLKQQEMLSKLGAKDLKDAQAKVEALKAQGKTKEEIIRLTGEEAYQSLVNASMQEKIGAFMDKIKQSISDFVEKSGIIEKIESFFEYLSKPENIRKIIEGVRDFFAGAVEFIGKAAYYILEGLDYVALGQIPDDFIDSIKSGAENMGAQIRSLGGDFGAVGVGNTAAKSQVSSTQAAAVTPQNNMMARPLNITVKGGNVVDTQADAQNRYQKSGFVDNQTGQ